MGVSFGSWLKTELKEQRLRGADIARRTGYSPTYISNLLRDYSPNTKKGFGRPSEEAVKKIARSIKPDLKGRDFGLYVDEARNAAGYAPINSTLPEEIVNAIGNEDELDKDDIDSIVKYIEFVRLQKVQLNTGEGTEPKKSRDGSSA